MPNRTQEFSCNQPWRARDFAAAAALFLATAAVVLWQNAHLTVLWDLSYTLDSSYRIALGQMPYRDFPFVHAPLTFLIQAAIIRLAGRVYFHHVLYTAIVGGLGTVLAWRIALRTLMGRLNADPIFSWIAALLLAAPLTVLGIYSILPLPSYDCDSAFAILVAVYFLQRLAANSAATSKSKPLLWAFATGAAVALPLFVKQNIGLPMVAVAVIGILVLITAKLLRSGAVSADELSLPALLAVLAGISATVGLGALLLHFTVGLGNYLHWTIRFAMQRRLPALDAMLGIYQNSSLLWMLPCVIAALILLRCRWAKRFWVQLLALALIAAPFLWTLVSLFLTDDADDRADALLALWPLVLVLAAALTFYYLLRGPLHRALTPTVLLAAIHGTLLSQQLWGSTYAIWPLFILLVAEMLAFLAEKKSPDTQKMIIALAASIALTLTACGGLYMVSEERLEYIDLPDGPVLRATQPALAGMRTPGPYLTNFEELLRFVKAEIPAADGLILLPGEDPFYFATGRAPRFPVLLFDPATDPYSPAQLVEEARTRKIRWLIVKRALQIKEDVTPQREATMKLLLNDFTLYRQLTGYDIYRRKE